MNLFSFNPIAVWQASLDGSSQAPSVPCVFSLLSSDYRPLAQQAGPLSIFNATLPTLSSCGLLRPSSCHPSPPSFSYALPIVCEILLPHRVFVERPLGLFGRAFCPHLPFLRSWQRWLVCRDKLTCEWHLAPYFSFPLHASCRPLHSPCCASPVLLPGPLLAVFSRNKQPLLILPPHRVFVERPLILVGRAFCPPLPFLRSWQRWLVCREKLTCE